MGLLDDVSFMGGGFNSMGMPSAQMMRQYQQMRNIRLLDPERQLREMGPMRGMGNRGAANPWFAQMGQLGNTPDYSGFTYDPGANAAASAALRPYGLSPLNPNQVNPNAIFPNSGFFGRHPGLTSRLEGGIFGAAATRGANTWGEGISNVAQSMIEGPRAKAGIVNQQFARPFQQAQMLESLQDMQQKRELTEADIQWRRAEAQKAGQSPFPKYGEAKIGAKGEAYMFPNDGGEPKQVLPPGTFNTKDDKVLSPEEQAIDAFRREQKREPTSQELVTLHNEWTEKERKAANAANGAKMAVPNGKGGFTFQVIQPGSPIPAGSRTINDIGTEQHKETASREKFLASSASWPASRWARLKAFGVKRGDMQSLGQFYDQNISSGAYTMDESGAPRANGDAPSPTPSLSNPFRK